MREAARAHEAVTDQRERPGSAPQSSLPRDDGPGELRTAAAAAGDAPGVRLDNVGLSQDLDKSPEDLQRFHDFLLQQEEMAALGRLAAGVAHEMNSPLAVVAGLAEMLLEQVNAPPLAGLPALANFPKYLRQIADQALRCGTLVSHLLAYARPREAQVKPVDLWRVVEDTLVLLASKVRPLGRRFQAVRDPGALDVLADAPMLQQVIISLFSNALDAVEGGGTMRLAARREENRPGDAAVVLEVADTGMGITPEALPHMFDLFFTTKGPDRGTGLGLPLCLRIVEQHGGTLAVESPGPGQGTTATVRLPAAP